MRVKVQQFEGPLDLLLQLIEQEKLDIAQISLSSVTEQFLRYMRSQTNIAPGQLADWLVIAAKLLVIKSRILVPSLKFDEEEEQDAASLAWQLYEYKKYKEAAKYLRGLDTKRKQGWSRHLTFVEKITFFPDPNVTSSVLRDAMRSLAKILEEIIRLPEKVLEEVVTISEKIDALQKLIYEKVEIKLRDLLKSAKSKTEVKVTFLALLELVKQKILSVEQETIFSEILIRKKT